MSISLMAFMEVTNIELLDKIRELEAKKFPPILMLMNINGTLIHRTSERVEFTKCKSKDDQVDFGA